MNKNNIVVVSTHLETDLLILHIALASLAPPWPDTLALEVVRLARADVDPVGAGGTVLDVKSVNGVNENIWRIMQTLIAWRTLPGRDTRWACTCRRGPGS